MKKIFNKSAKIMFSLLIISNIIFAASKISGIITDKNGPIPYVNVFFSNGMEGTMTDDNGSFNIEIFRAGNLTLKLSHIKYIEKELPITITDNKNISLNVVLEESMVEMDAITVSAGSFTAADKEGKTINSMDVVTTAGAAADILKAIQTFPGVVQVDEGAGLFVRGGDASETKMFLDGATMVHPYKYESDQGGFFGMLNPFQLKGTYFSTGGFSAKYGNALSGVLAMESLDMPEINSLDFGLGLAAASLGFNKSINDKLGVRFAGNYSDCTALFKLNNSTEEYDNYPVSWDASFSTMYKLSDKTKLKYFFIGTQDEITFQYRSPSYTGNMNSRNKNMLHNIHLSKVINEDFNMKTSISFNQFSKDFNISKLRSDTQDNFGKLRTDFSYKYSQKIKFNFGFDADMSDYQIDGTYPVSERDLNEDSEFYTYSHNYDNNHQGGYIESKIFLTKKLFTLSGVRFDNSSENDATVDPRVSFIYRLSEGSSVKFASGIYHQFAKSQFHHGNYHGSKLLPMKAIHYIGGYEYKNEMLNLKSEFYYKDYSNLPLEENETAYNSNGHGYSYGADFFLKGNLPICSGWISYSYLVSERKELEYQKLVPGNYDIRHNFVAALKKYFPSGYSLSLTYKAHSGKPYTATLNEWNQKNLPAIHSLDLSLSYFTSLKGNNFIVYYVSLSNLLDTSNVYGYYYSPDYSQRTEMKSIFGRSIYFGFSMSLGKLTDNF